MRSYLIDIREAFRFNPDAIRRLRDHLFGGFAFLSTTPALRATPPSKGGEFFAYSPSVFDSFTRSHARG